MRNAKTTWRACSICGTMGGRIPPRGKTPGRNSLKKFGIEGVGCLTCYDRLAKQEERAHAVRDVPGGSDSAV